MGYFAVALAVLVAGAAWYLWRRRRPYLSGFAVVLTVLILWLGWVSADEIRESDGDGGDPFATETILPTLAPE